MEAGAGWRTPAANYLVQEPAVHNWSEQTVNGAGIAHTAIMSG